MARKVPIMNYSALLFVPNVIGVDGCVARALGQCSPFGAWLDVLVDNIGRTILWTGLHSAGVFVVCVEWTVFVCTHTLGHQWKTTFGAAPQWVKTVMDNGFYTPVGVFTIAGLHVFPAYLYFLSHLPPGWASLPPALLYGPAVMLAAGRLICLAVELWCIKAHILHLLSSEEDSRVSTLTRELRSDSNS